MTTTAHEIFSTLDKTPEGDFDFSFTSETDLDNHAAMAVFLEEHDLGEYVEKDYGTMVWLFHPDYNFPVLVESTGGGDFFTHIIAAFRDPEVEAEIARDDA